MERVDRILKRVIYIVGFVTTVAILSGLALMAATRVIDRIEHPRLNRGVVTRAYHDDGSPSYMDYSAGPYTLRIARGGRERYMIEVMDAQGRTDWWEVSEEEYRTMEFGKPISRDQLK